MQTKISTKILSHNEGKYQKDHLGNELWWFGTIPTSGLPQPENIIKNIKTKKLNIYPPPWAVVIKDNINKDLYICTDIGGLKHLYYSVNSKQIFISPNVFEIAKHISVSINPTSAYELLTIGNPQEDRTLFNEIKCAPPASILKIGDKISIETYWQIGEYDPIKDDEAVELFKNTLLQILKDNWNDSMYQELTAGRDSMLLLAAHLHLNLPIKTWTHGTTNDYDIIGAIQRSKFYSVHHEPIYTDQLNDLSVECCIEHINRFLIASGGMANALEYWKLSWILDKLQLATSITGGGGELYRGFYYEWAGKDKLPKVLGKQILFHGKIKERMPFPNKIISTDVVSLGENAIYSELEKSLSLTNNYWHNLDIYYFNKRMHHFAAATFSTVDNWYELKVPLCDSRLVEILPRISINLRNSNNGIINFASINLLKDRGYTPLEISRNKSKIRKSRLKKLSAKTRNINGTIFPHSDQQLKSKILNELISTNYLTYDNMLTNWLYDKNKFSKLINNISSGESIPYFLGAIVTIEMAAKQTNVLQI